MSQPGDDLGNDEHAGMPGGPRDIRDGAFSPPDLSRASTQPRYTPQEVVELLAVPAYLLWEWEQVAGIPRPARLPDSQGNSATWFSERDVVAARWLRDQSRLGASIHDAAQTLLAAQRDRSGMLPAPGQTSTPRTPPAGFASTMPAWSDAHAVAPPAFASAHLSAPVTPDAIPFPVPGQATSGQVSRTSMPLSGQFVFGAPSRPSAPIPGAPGAPAPNGSSSLYPPRFSGPLGFGAPSPYSRPGASGAFGAPAPGSTPERFGGTASFGPASGPTSLVSAADSGIRPSGALSGPSLGRISQVGPLFGQASAVPGSPAYSLLSQTATAVPSTTRPDGPSPTPGRQRMPIPQNTGGLRMLQSALMRGFHALDPDEVTALLDDALNTYPIETVCVSLILPLLQRMAELAEHGQATHIEQQFAATMLRTRLANLMDTVPVALDAPLALIACAPGEYHDLGTLILGVLWRRAGIRAVYLGPDVVEDALAIEARHRRPNLICLSAATDAGARALAHTTSVLAHVEPPRPTVVYGGAAFVRSPDLQRRVKDALFLGVDVMVATRHVLQLLNDGPVILC